MSQKRKEDELPGSPRRDKDLVPQSINNYYFFLKQQKWLSSFHLSFIFALNINQALHLPVAQRR